MKRMRCVALVAAASSLVWLAGCASVPNVAIREPIGPAPSGAEKASGQGYLEVYSARQREPLADNLGEWQWEYDMGDNVLADGLARTGYIIRTDIGTVLKYVPHSRNTADSQPTLVTLPPGRYQIEAQAEQAGRQSLTVLLPVLIEPGKTTVAHLSGHWKPKVQFSDSDVVRLPDGQIAGWLARQ
jgi:hypothetical protein